MILFIDKCLNRICNFYAFYGNHYQFYRTGKSIPNPGKIKNSEKIFCINL